MALFMMPSSGHAVGGGGPGPTDPPPSGTGTDAPKARFGKRRKIMDLDKVPPGQIPSAPPPYAWPPLERKDWRPGLSVIEDTTAPPATSATEPLRSTDPASVKRDQLHAEATKLRQEIAKLRDELHRALEASRQQDTYSAKMPFSGASQLPKLPRATRPFPTPAYEAFATIAPGTPLHFRPASSKAGLSPITSHIVGIRAEISKKQMRLSQIRAELKTIAGKNPVFNTQIRSSAKRSQPGAPVQHKAAALMGVRHQMLGHPKPQPAKPVAAAAQKLKRHGTQWTKKPSEHRTEEHHPRFVSRGRWWRSPLKCSQ